MIQISSNYRKAFVEVEAVLSCLNKEEYNKMPEDIIKAIRMNKDKDYVYKFDEKLDYESWEVMPETKAILYNILKQFLANDEQREYFRKKELLEMRQAEKGKVKKYNSDNVFKNKNNKVSEKKENDQIIEYKENFIKKIFNKIKKLLNMWIKEKR